MENLVELKIKLAPGAVLPQYKTQGAAGADICALLKENVTLKPFERKAITTGLFFEIPQNYEIQIRPRSGLAIKNGISLVNTPATIDSDYRGELHVILINLGSEDFVIHNGDRIAQMVLSPVTIADFKVVTELSQTQRGTNGFGSTGV